MNQYNDYELLYMINEFDEEAETIFYNKYRNLILKRMLDFKIKPSYRDDFMQEGLFVLTKAIRNYDIYSNKSFNKFFDLLLQRRFSNILRDEKKYFYNVIVKENESFIFENNSFVYNDCSEYYTIGLSDFEKEVLRLRNKKLRPNEIAKKLNCDTKSIYNCICRIKIKIKND